MRRWSNYSYVRGPFIQEIKTLDSALMDTPTRRAITRLTKTVESIEETHSGSDGESPAERIGLRFEVIGRVYDGSRNRNVF